MKTKYYKRWNISKDSKEDLKIIIKTDLKTIEILIDFLKNLDEYIQIDSNIVRELTSKTDENAETIYKLIYSLDYLLFVLARYDDSTENIIDDLKKFEIYEKDEEYEILLDLLNKLTMFSTEYYKLYQISSASNKGIDFLESSTMTVVSKPVFDKRFDYYDDEISKYEPKIIDFANVAIISLKKHKTIENFNFQLDKKGLNVFITELLALQAELQILELETKR